MLQGSRWSPPAGDRVVISVNPKAGARSSDARVARLGELLTQNGFRPDVLTDLAEVGEAANRWYSEGRLRALVGVGGDGTAAELVNRTRHGVPLTMLPTGNENLLARYLGLGTTPEAVCETIRSGSVIRLDAARAGQRVFLLMIGCGFDAEVVHLVHQRRTGHMGTRHYVKPILEVVRSYRYPEIRFEWLEESASGESSAVASAVARWVFVFNMPCYGGGLRLAPQADGRDGLLDVCAFRRGSLWHGLQYAAAVATGRHQRLGDCLVRRVRRMRISSEAEVRYQLDGDPGGVLPVDVEVLPRRLAVVVPADSAHARAAATDGPA